MSDETPGIPRLWAPLTTIWLKFTFIQWEKVIEMNLMSSGRSMSNVHFNNQKEV